MCFIIFGKRDVMMMSLCLAADVSSISFLMTPVFLLCKRWCFPQKVQVEFVLRSVAVFPALLGCLPGGSLGC